MLKIMTFWDAPRKHKHLLLLTIYLFNDFVYELVIGSSSLHVERIYRNSDLIYSISIRSSRPVLVNKISSAPHTVFLPRNTLQHMQFQ